MSKYYLLHKDLLDLTEDGNGDVCGLPIMCYVSGQKPTPGEKISWGDLLIL